MMYIIININTDYIMNKREIQIDDCVVNEMERLVLLAKQGRKKLKPTEVTEYTSINPTEIWDLMKQYSLLKKTQDVPIDVVRMIMLYLDAKQYRRMCLTLNKKFYDWVQRDTRKIELDINTTIFRKNGCSGSYYVYDACIYTDRFPIIVKIGEENENIKRSMCHQTEFNYTKNRYTADFIVKISTLDGKKEVFNDHIYDWTCSSKTKIIKSDGVDLETYWINAKGNIFDQNNAPQSCHFKHAILMFYK